MKNHSKLNGLSPFRKEINKLDCELIDILAKRFDVCAKVAEYKSIHDIPMMQPNRVDEVKERCAEIAISRGLSGDFVRDLYGRIIQEACLIETKLMENGEDTTG